MRGWDPAPGVLLYVALASCLFAQAVLRLRRRGRHDLASSRRPMVFGAALLLGALAVTSPLDAIGESDLLAAHMLQHVIIGDLAPALAVLAVRGPLLFFLLPRPVLRVAAASRALRATAAWLLRPRVAVSAWIVSLALWHVPFLYQAALNSQPLHDLQHISFVITGILVWTTLIDPARRRVLGPSGKLVVAACVFAAGQLLATILAVWPGALYANYEQQTDRLLGLSAAADQRLAAVVMMAVQLLTLGTFAALLLTSAGRTRPRRYGRPRPALEPPRSEGHSGTG